MVFLLDNGHGIDTPGKRSPVWSDGSQLFEWQFARDMVARIHLAASAMGVLTAPIVPEQKDVPLEERVRRANAWHAATSGGAVLLSIHANAGGGTGFEFYTSRGQTASDKIATQLCKSFQVAYQDIKLRQDTSDGDPDKEADFYILKHTKCPAVLAELLFMDYEKDCRKLMDAKFRQSMAENIAKTLKTIGK